MRKFVKKNRKSGAVLAFLTAVSDAKHPFGRIEPSAKLVLFTWNDDQADSSKYYMPDDEIVERPKVFSEALFTIPADGETLVQAQLPDGATVRHLGQVYKATADEPFEFCTAIPGEFVFEVEPAFPFQHQLIRIIAHAV
jgi:hypothetical protein